MVKRIKVKPVSLKAKSKPKRRRPWGELLKCYRCPFEHLGWTRGRLRMRRQMYYCPEHLKAFDERHTAWPSCPSCGGEEFGIMKWNGSVESTVAFCKECDFEALALQHFDRITIKITASPIVKH